MMIFTPIFLSTILGVIAATDAADEQPAEKTRLTVKTFFSASASNFWAAINQGYYDEFNIDLQINYTKSAIELKNDLTDGNVDMAYAVSDHVLNMGTDFVLLTGGDPSMNSFITQDYIDSFDDVMGQILTVDAPNTAYALQAYKVLQQSANVSAGEEYEVQPVGGTNIRYAAMVENSTLTMSVMSPPFSISGVAENSFNNLGRVIDIIGDYQAASLYAKRSFVEANADAVSSFIAASIKGNRWLLDPSNKDDVIALLKENLNIDDGIASETYASMTEEGFGLTKDMAFLTDGFENVISLREEFEGGGPYVAQDYVDLYYYDNALATLDDSSANSVGRTANIFVAAVAVAFLSMI